MTEPLKFPDLTEHVLRLRQMTAEPSEFYVPKSDAELGKLLAECQDPNLIAALTKEYLKSKDVLDVSHPFGESGTTLNPDIRATPSMVSGARNAATSMPSAEMVRLCEQAKDPSELQNALSHQLHNEPIFEVRQQAPPPPPLFNENDRFFQRCYPSGNLCVDVSADSQEELDRKVDAVYAKYGKVRGADFR